MATDYVPTTVSQGFGQETAINANFDAIKTALDACLQRINSTANTMSIDLDMGGNQVLNTPAPIAPTDLIRLIDVNSLAVPEVVETLTFSAAISVDIDQVTYGILTLTGNTTITFTGGTTEGQVILLRLKQDATGSRIVTWDTKVHFSTDLPQPTLSTAANVTDYIVFRRNVADDKYDALAVLRGFS